MGPAPDPADRRGRRGQRGGPPGAGRPAGHHAPVGERTYRAARLAFRFDPPIAVEAKGKAEPIRAYRLLEALPGASSAACAG